MEFIAVFIGRPDFLLNHPDYGRYLLTEIERERQQTTANAGDILENAAKIRNALARAPAKECGEGKSLTKLCRVSVTVQDASYALVQIFEHLFD